MPNILFICTANICRSPVGQALFADWVRRRGLPGEWQIRSAGTWAEEGAPAATYSHEVLAEQGLDLTSHRSHRVEAADLEAADLVLCMTAAHREALQAEFPEFADRIVLLSAMAGAGYDIADPYGGPRSGYQGMVGELRDLIERGGDRIAADAQRRQKKGPRT